jgi:NADPH:quinone reductase-like Zn-dependent oxidoreductase
MKTNHMKAVIASQPGGPEVLEFKEVPIPAFGPDEVLIRIHAIGINPVDIFTRQSSYFGTFPEILGLDFAGYIDQVGTEVSEFSVGDRVVGVRPSPKDSGAYAEFTVAKPSQLALLPDSVTFEIAASLPVAAMTAYQVLYHDMDLQAGQSILIHGGAGGVGVFAIQLAKLKGAHVIATSSPANFDFLKELGADEVIDYNKNDFSKAGNVDAVLDPLARETREASFSLIKNGGILVSILPYPIQSERVDKGEIRAHTQYLKPIGADLAAIVKLVAEGKLKTIIQDVLPFAAIARAHEIVGERHTRGKIVLNEVH